MGITARAATTTLVALALVVTAAGGGCDILTALGGGEGLACREDQACANGLICIDRRCQRPGTCSSDEECTVMHAVCRNGACVVSADAGPADVIVGDLVTRDLASGDLGHGDLGRNDANSAGDVARDTGASDNPARADRPARDRTVSDGGIVDGQRADSGASDLGIPPPCGTVDVFRDDFNSAQPGAIWDRERLSQEPLQPDLSEQTLKFTVPVGSTSLWGTLRTWSMASLRNGRMTVEVVSSTFSASQNAYAYFQFGVDNDNYVSFMLYRDELNVDANSTTGHRELTNIGTFDLAVHRWWQIRGSDDAVFFETSSDGIDYATCATIAAPWFIDRGYVLFGAGTIDSTANTADISIAFDNLNLDPGRSSRVGWCPASSLQEDFNPPLGPEWGERNNAASSCVFQYGPALLIAVPIGADPFCSIATTTAYALAYDSVAIHVTGVSATDDVIAGIFLSSPTTNIEFGLSNNDIMVWGRADPSCDIISRRTNENMLRIGYDGVALLFETGVAGTDTWLLFATCAVAALDPVQIDIGMSPMSGAAVSENQASFDNYNLLP